MKSKHITTVRSRRAIDRIIPNPHYYYYYYYPIIHIEYYRIIVTSRVSRWIFKRFITSMYVYVLEEATRFVVRDRALARVRRFYLSRNVRICSVPVRPAREPTASPNYGMKNLHRICILYGKHNTDEKSIDCTRYNSTYIVFIGTYARVGILYNINDLFMTRTARLKVEKTDTFITTAGKRLTKNNYNIFTNTIAIYFIIVRWWKKKTPHHR